MKSKSLLILSLFMMLFLMLQACSPAVVSESEEADTNTSESEEAETETESNIENETVEDETESTITEEEEVESEAEVEEPSVLTTIIDTDPDTLDPHKTGTVVSSTILNYIGASLVEKDPEGNIIPYLAETWEVSEDGLVYTFYLRDDVSFFDGTPLVAQDFVYTYERAMDPEIASPVAATNLGTAVTFEAPDDYTFVITLAEPFAPFLYALADPGYMQPILQSDVEEQGDQFGRLLSGVGPYRVAEWQVGDYILLEKNPNYSWGTEFYGSGPYLIDFIEFRIIGEQSTAVAGLESGEMDLGTIDAKDLTLFEGLDFTILQQPQKGTGMYVSIQNQDPVLSNQNIRIALNKAIDRNVVVDIIEQGRGSTQLGPLTKSTIGYWEGVEEFGYAYDPEGAKALLEAEGYVLNDEGIFEKDGNKLSFTLLTMPVENWIKLAELLQSMFADIGVEITIQEEEQGLLVQHCFAGEYELVIMGISYSEADILYQMFHSSQIGAGLNIAFVNDPDLDEMLENTRTLIDSGERLELVHEVQKYIAQQAAMLTLYSSTSNIVISNEITGYEFYPTTGLSLVNAYYQ